MRKGLAMPLDFQQCWTLASEHCLTVWLTLRKCLDPLTASWPWSQLWTWHLLEWPSLYKIYNCAYYNPGICLHGAYMGIPVPCMVNTCLYHAWNTPVPRMEYASTMHGIRLYHAWNTPAPCMEYTCIMHGIRLHHARNTPMSHMEYTCTMHLCHA